MRGRVRRFLVAGLLVVASSGAGCAEPTFPKDPEGTLERVSGGVLHVGVSENPPHTTVADDGSVGGTEVDIIQGYADRIGATVEWIDGAESELMEMLRQRDVDVVIGGLTASSPWSTHAAFSRPYATTVGPDGKAAKLVVATRLGENALLTNLERYLIDEGLQP